MKIRKISSLWMIISVIVALAVVLPISACAAPTGTAPSGGTVSAPVKLKAYGTTTASGLHTYDVMEAEVLSKAPNITVASVPGEGIYQCVDRLINADGDIAMASPAYLYRTLYGVLDQTKAWSQDARMLWTYSSTPICFFVTKDSGITSLEQLNGKRFGFASGSEMSYICDTIINIAGAKPDYLKTATTAIEDAIMNRQCVGYAMPGNPMAMATNVATKMPITILPVSKEYMDKGMKLYPGLYTPAVIPAGMYPGQDKDVPTIRNVLSKAAHKRVPQVVVYQMAKVMYENRAAIAKANPQADVVADWPKATLDSVATPLHAGIVQFFINDLKLNVPKQFIPPEYK